ncbi:MAG: RsmB/NOP family class I SAM-dependent RNA methyltransferase [Candidatus Bathyarchaeota archaeon]|nr:MAG: RsmB/NOP family class I SAM-dependent RNA methyltransferase [Candidatus Bathyarchaeota archaeon]
MALAKATKQMGIKDARVVGLAHKMVFETVRKQNLIDFLLNSALALRSLNDFKLGPKAFLRLYTHETKIVNGDFEKAVRIARMGRSILGWRELRGAEETLGEILSIQPSQALKQLSDEERIALSTYNPTWFVKYCFRLLGRDEALKFLRNTTEISPTYIRINTLKMSEKAALQKMEEEGVILEKSQQLKYTYKVVEAQKPLMRTRSFHNGLFFVQDKASCLATEVASPQTGMTVLDVCAAPGAKTTHLAQLMQNQGMIYSIEYSKRRMRVWKRETKRMGAKIVFPLLADARKPLPVKFSADLVILDPPCTSTGVFSKVPSAKWRLTKRSILSMARIQWEMLNQCAEHVKDGGFLVYSTCSIALEENEMLIERFMKWHPEFTLVEASPRIGSLGLRGQTESQRLYPHIHGCNGFFVAKLQKQA